MDTTTVAFAVFVLASLGLVGVLWCIGGQLAFARTWSRGAAGLWVSSLTLGTATGAMVWVAGRLAASSPVGIPLVLFFPIGHVLAPAALAMALGAVVLSVGLLRRLARSGRILAGVALWVFCLAIGAAVLSPLSIALLVGPEASVMWALRRLGWSGP